MGVSKRRVKGSQREKRGQRRLGGGSDNELSEARSGYTPAQRQQEPPGDFPAFAENICCVVPE